jgi:serine/threonine protein kinase
MSDSSDATDVLVHLQLRGAFQDQNCLYMLMDWVPGGELFHYIDVMRCFDEPTAKFYAANAMLSMEYLHGKGIVYRDLKPENLVMEANGYLKLADFGFAKHVGSNKAFTICGTPDYQAPEVIMRRGTTKAADYWAIGVLIFEMLVGEPPFMSASGNPWDTFRRAMTGRCHVPSHVSTAAADLIYKLLQVRLLLQ